MEDHLGRKIEKGELVHHIDMDKTNNLPSNLHLFASRSEHVSCHNAMENCGYELLGKMVWFNLANKQYSVDMQPAVDEASELCVPETGKRHINQFGYEAYQEKDAAGVWRHKSYHILVAEAMIGRKLFHDECVHHVDGNKSRNIPSNLCVMTRTEHSSCHAALQKIVADMYKKHVVQFEGGMYCLAV